MYGTSSHTNRSEKIYQPLDYDSTCRLKLAGCIIYHNVYIEHMALRLYIQLTTIYLTKQST